MNIDNLTIGEAKKLASMFGGSGCAPKNDEYHDKIAVLVWTDKRGVIFGYTENYAARPIELTEARMCLYWSVDVGGVFGLAEIGPTQNCKISATLPMASFEGVTGVAKVSEKAEKAWLSAPVQGR